MVPETTVAILDVPNKIFYVRQIQAETLCPDRLRIKEKVICIFLLPAGCNLCYQVEQRPNATSIKLEETQRLNLTFTPSLKTLLLRHISDNWIILIKDTCTLHWLTGKHISVTVVRQVPTNISKTSELVKCPTLYAGFFIHLCLCCKMHFIERNCIYSFLYKDNLTHT